MPMRLSGVVATLPAAVSAMVLAATALAYEESAVAAGGTISGKVLYNGPIPTKKIIPTKNSDVCGGIRDQALIKVGPGKGVEGAVAYLKNVGKGKAWPEPGRTPTLDQSKCKFSPHVQVIRGGKLDIINSDPVLHNTHGFYGKRTAFNLALPNKGERIEVELSRSGTVRVECDAHGWMLAWVYVAANPYYALTAEDGAFNITDVPPGSYTLVTWQEHTGPVETAVTVEAGKATEVSVELKM